MNRTNLINYIIKKQGYKSYLEIGIGTGRNFKAIECEKKKSLDPDENCNADYKMTSNEYFNRCRILYDIIFIDGLHHADQVKQDILSSWFCLNDGGCLVLHDTNPDREEITHVPRTSKEWTGNVYQVIHQIKSPKLYTFKEDHGVTFIRKTCDLEMNNDKIDWQTFDTCRSVILNLVSWEDAKKIVDLWK